MNCTKNNFLTFFDNIIDILCDNIYNYDDDEFKDEYSKIINEKYGLTVVDYTWYDGPIITIKSELYEMTYAHCANTISFVYNSDIVFNFEECNKSPETTFQVLDEEQYNIFKQINDEYIMYIANCVVLKLNILNMSNTTYANLKPLILYKGVEI